MADPRFEVPPEYADVYERAFRAAYDERDGLGEEPPARRSDVRVPRQRRDSTPEAPGSADGSARSTLRSAHLRGTHDALAARDAEARVQVPATATVRSSLPPEPDDGFGAVKRHRQRVSVMPLVLMSVVAIVALAAAFGLGWLSSGLG